MRYKRTSGNAAYTYYYNGDLLRYLDYDSNTTDSRAAAKLYFVLDASGKPISVSYRPEGSTTTGFYFYVHNLQGDVEALVDYSTGNPVVWYTYDAWGNVLSVGGSLANTLGKLNPFRYRSYVYDDETELYYLQSRYYDPEMGRFISADEYPTTGQGLTGNNMFAYCGNNPIVREDSGGEWWHLAIGAMVGVGTQIIADLAAGSTSTVVDYASAAIGGALAASGIGFAGAVAANAALGGATYLLNCNVNEKKVNALDFSLSVIVGATAGAIGGSGADGANLRGVYKASRQILKTAVSPKKITMYTAKIAAVRDTLIESTIRTVTAGLFGNAANMGRKEMTGSAY